MPSMSSCADVQQYVEYIEGLAGGCVPSRDQIKQAMKSFPDTGVFWNKQIFQLVLVYYLLLDLDNLGTNYGAWTCGALGVTECILLLQRVIRNMKGFCFHRSDAAATKSKRIHGILKIFAEACGGIASLMFIAGNLFAFLFFDPNETITPGWFAGGAGFLAANELLDLSSPGPEGFHGNKRHSNIIGIPRNLLVALGTFFGLVTSLTSLGFNQNTWTESVRDPILGSCSTFMLLLKMVFDGAFYGPQPNQGFYNKIKLAAHNLSQSEATAMTFMLLAMSKPLFETNMENPAATILGLAALAVATNVSSIATMIGGLVSDVRSKTCWSANAISKAIKALESALLAAAHIMVGVDALSGTKLIGSTKYPLLVAGSQVLETVSDALSNRSNPQKAMNMLPKVLGIAMLMYYGLGPDDQFVLGALLFILFNGIDLITRATQPAARSKGLEQQPLLGDSDASVNNA